MTVEVVRATERSRYEVRVDGELAGFADFRLADGRLELFHTEIDEAYGGRGLGTRLAGDALADAARRAERIVPTCPFIASYLRKHDVADAHVDWPDASTRSPASPPPEEEVAGP